jgi:hypothetical protein
MVWMFERGDDSLRLETRYDSGTAEYVLITHRADGRQEIERFPDAVTFRKRLEGLEGQLEAERWRQTGSLLLHDGWKLT